MKPVKAYWSHTKAVTLLDEDNSCCERVLSTRLVPLMPKYIGKWREGIRAILDMDLGKYTEWLTGVLLGYNNMKVARTCLPMEDQPYMHVNIQFDAIIFKPAIGSMLKCTVNEIAPDHISCLAHNYFNVSIPLPMTNKSDQRYAKLQGVELQVEISKMHSMHGIISIQGKLPPNFESILANLKVSESAPIDEATSDDMDSTASVSILTSPNRRKSKQSPCSIAVSSSEIDSSTEISSSKKKKKKRKHPKDEVVAVKLDLGSDDALDIHGHDDRDVSPPKDISPRKSGSKNKDRKKKRVSTGEETVYISPQFIKDENHLEQSIHSNASDFNEISDNFTPRSSSKKRKKKKYSLESKDWSKDLDSDVHMKTEPDSGLEQTTFSPKSSKSKKRSSDIAEWNGNIQLKTEMEDGFESSLSKSSKKKEHKRVKDRKTDDLVKRELDNGLDQQPCVPKSSKKKKPKLSTGLNDIDIHPKTEPKDGLMIKQEAISLYKPLKDKHHKHRKSHVGK